MLLKNFGIDKRSELVTVGQRDYRRVQGQVGTEYTRQPTSPPSTGHIAVASVYRLTKMYEFRFAFVPKPNYSKSHDTRTSSERQMRTLRHILSTSNGLIHDFILNSA